MLLCHLDNTHFNYDVSQRAGFAISTIASVQTGSYVSLQLP